MAGAELQEHVADETIDLAVRPARHPGHWAGTLVVAVLVTMAVHTLFANPRFEWDVVRQYVTAESIILGVRRTVELTAITMAIGVGLGVVIAVLRLSPNPELSLGIPFGPGYLQLDVNVLITPYIAAVLGLALNESAYMAEIVRAGILSVDQGQTEAAQALGMSRLRTRRRVVLPQAMRVIAVPELLFASQTIYTRAFQTIPLLLVAVVWYLIVVSVLSVGQYDIERRFAGGASRNLPLTPFQKLKKLFGWGQRGPRDLTPAPVSVDEGDPR